MEGWSIGKSDALDLDQNDLSTRVFSISYSVFTCPGILNLPFFQPSILPITRLILVPFGDTIIACRNKKLSNE